MNETVGCLYACLLVSLCLFVCHERLHFIEARKILAGGFCIHKPIFLFACTSTFILNACDG